MPTKLSVSVRDCLGKLKILPHPGDTVFAKVDGTEVSFMTEGYTVIQLRDEFGNDMPLDGTLANNLTEYLKTLEPL